MGLLKTLKPEWWFSAHMHTRFTATVEHEGVRREQVAPLPVQNPDEIRIEDDDFEGSVPTRSARTPAVEAVECVSKNPDEITLDDEEEGVHVPPPPPPPPSETKFLALDKCLPRRQFLEVIPSVNVLSGSLNCDDRLLIWTNMRFNPPNHRE
jgi:lariat debranching enzyme